MMPCSYKEFFQMKELFAFLLGLSSILASCSSPQRTTTPTIPPQETSTSAPPSQQTMTLSPDDGSMEYPWDDRSIFKNGLIESQQSTLDGLEGASVYHIELNIEDDLFHVNGHQEVQYTNTETVPLNEVQLRLFPNIVGGELEVSNIRVNDETVTPAYDLGNSLMILPFATPLETGQSTVLKMDFTVTVPQDVELNYGVLAYYDDVLALGHAYPMICVYDDEGWNAEIPPQSGDVTYSDASFYLVKVTAPRDLTLVTTGQKLSSSDASQVQTLSVASGPARDFYLVASPKYEEVSQSFGETTIHSY